MAAGRPAIESGRLADGTQQRLRHGLGEFKAYRYKGKPGWNPARVLEQFTGKPLGRQCGKCGAEPGEPCLNKAGRLMRGHHTAR
jgi:hypothetical protein